MHDVNSSQIVASHEYLRTSLFSRGCYKACEIGCAPDRTDLGPSGEKVQVVEVDLISISLNVLHGIENLPS